MNDNSNVSSPVMLSAIPVHEVEISLRSSLETTSSTVTSEQDEGDWMQAQNGMSKNTPSSSRDKISLSNAREKGPTQER